MSPRPHLSSKGLVLLADTLSDRDMAIVHQVAELRLISAGQLRALHFPKQAHESEAAAVRSCNRVLKRLSSDRVLARLERRIGGRRAGSASYIYALGTAGHRLLAMDRPRPRSYEPTARFADHTLAVAQIVVDATIADRAGALDLAGYQAEPACWRRYSRSGARAVLRPDLLLAINAAGLRYSWWVEVDRGSESLPVIVRKCRTYASYYQSGIEQARSDGTFPRVCWIAPTERRAKRIADAIARDRQLPEPLFVVTRSDHALGVLTGATP